jgi:hypothetical protein
LGGSHYIHICSHTLLKYVQFHATRSNLLQLDYPRRFPVQLTFKQM